MTCSSAIIPFNFPIQNHELLNISTVDKVKDNTNTTNTSATFIHHPQTKISFANQSIIKLDQSNESARLGNINTIFDADDLAVTNPNNQERSSASNSSSIQTLSNSSTNMNNGLSNGHDHRLNLDPATTTITNPSTTTTGLSIISSSSSSTSTTTSNSLLRNLSTTVSIDHSLATTTTTTPIRMGILSSPDNANFLLFPHARRDGSDFKILENGDGSDDVDSATSSHQDWTSTMASSVDQLSNEKNGSKMSILTNSSNESHILPQITTTISLASTTVNHKTINSDELRHVRTDQISQDVESTSTTNNRLTMIQSNNNNSLVQNSCDSKIECSSSSLSSNQPSHQQSITCFQNVVLDDAMMPIDDDHHRQLSDKCDGDHTIEPLEPTLASFLPSPPSSSQSLLGGFDINIGTISTNVSNSHEASTIIAQKKEEEKLALEKQESEKQKSICNDLLSKQQNMRKFNADMKHRIRRLQLQYTHKNLSKQMKLFVAENQRLNGVHCQRFELDFSNFMNLDYGMTGPTTMAGVLSSDCHHHHQSPFMISQNELKMRSDHSLIQPSKSDIKLTCGNQNFSDSSLFQPSINNKQANRLQSDLILSNQASNIDVQQQQIHFQPKESSSSKSRSPRLLRENREKLLTTIDSWRYNLRHLESKYDSDATESSSGGESCDESESFDDIFIDKSMTGSSTYSTTSIPPSPHSSLAWPTISHQSAAIAKHQTSV